MNLPLVGLLEDALLPGEERELTAPALDAAARAALDAHPAGAPLAFVTITSPVELPGLVSGRYATEATILSTTPTALRVRGARRVRIVQVLGQKAPYAALVDDTAVPSVPELPLVQALHRLAGALTAPGALPESSAADTHLTAAAAALLRAATPFDELPQLARHELPDTLAKRAELVLARAPAHAAEARLEEVVRALAPAEALPPAQKRRLWSAVVEIERKLDVYDPGAGSDESDLGRLEKRLKQAGLPKEAKEVAKRELRLLRGMESRHHDYTAYLTHLDLMARLAWHPAELPPLDLSRVRTALDRAHWGMEKVKRRVLEYLAVRALGGTSSSTVLCLAGPPGVGKTTIARAMAEALGRPFVRVALGGMHDEAELRGHRMTFTAALPGRLLQGLAQTGNACSLVLLDELDKIGIDRSRSPVGALMEILDPEQHTHFSDNFLAVPYDLSHVLFVCTANDLSLVNPILLDRLEVVELEGYSVEDKLQLARGHLLPRLAQDSGLSRPLVFEDAVLAAIVEGHTREAGVRQLSRQLAALHRARALEKVNTGAEPPPDVTRDEVDRVLGPGRRRSPRDERLPRGTALGLSVSADGGAILPVESTLLPGAAGLALTGSAGKVLKESARTVLAHLRSDPTRFGLGAGAFERRLHVHLPEAATPKDGPSAGVALFCALLSSVSGRPVRADVAMTGEVTLTGRVMPVGGVRAKVMAAERAGLARVIVPVENRADVPERLRLAVVFASTLDEVRAAAFESAEAAAGPLAAVAGGAA